MLIVYKGRSRAGREIPVGNVDIHAPWGVPVEVPDEIAAALCARGDYHPHKPKAAKAESEE